MEISEIQQHTTNAQLVKDITLNRLYMDGMITIDDYNKYSEKYQIIVIKNTWFKKWFSKFQNNEKENEFIYKMVKFED